MSEALTREIEELRLLMGSPRDPHGRVFAQLGNALRRAGSHREALSVLLDGVSEHPNFSPGHLVLGWTAQESGDATVARTAFERTLELDPENPNGLFGLGTLLDREGDPRGASLIEEAESLDARVRALAPHAPEELREIEAAPNSEGAAADREGSAPDNEGVAPDREDPALERLPFLSLDEMAPASEEGRAPAPPARDETLSGLPFVALDELAPDAEEAAADGSPADDGSSTDVEVAGEKEPAAGEAEASGGELAATGATEDEGASLDALPFVSLEELRPGPELAPGFENHLESEADAEFAVEAEPELEAATEAEPGMEPAPQAEAELGAETPLAEHDHDDEDEGLDLAGPLATRTMAELLVRQGLLAQAIEVFETLVERSPEDSGLWDRLAELRVDLEGGAGTAAEAGGDLEGPAQDAAGVYGVEDAGGEASPVDDPDESSAHPSMDPPVPHPEVPSPFHLGAAEAEESAEEDEERVGDYFSRLLGWSPTHSPDPDEPGGASAEEESDLS